MSSLCGFADRARRHAAAISLAAGFLVGAFAWSGHTLTLPLALLFVVGFRVIDRGAVRAIYTISYFVGATWPVLPGASIFYGPAISPGGIVLMWLGFASLLALPWFIFCGSRPRELAWAVPLCLLLSVVPPLGLIGFANPLSSAGVLFPGAGWYGLLALLCLASVMAARPRYGVPAWALLFAVAFVSYHRPPQPVHWTAINTDFGGTGINTPDPLSEYQNAQYIQRTALSSPANVIVFPETAVYRWNNATDLFWSHTIDNLAAHGKTIIVGAGVSVPASSVYRNTAIVRGRYGPGTFDQRIPIPVAMWRPGRHDGVPLNLQSRGTYQLGQDQAAISLCYEQLLTWPILTAMLERPTVLVGMANDYWAKTTPIPNIQRSCLQAWAKLFRLPLVEAVNS
jgi:hypothetical protein